MAVSFKTSGLTARSLGILADRARNFLMGPGIMRVMHDAGVDLAARQRALIDSRGLKALSASRREQRARRAPPRGIVVHGTDHPLKATGQLHASIFGGARRVSGGLAAAVAATKATKRVPETAPSAVPANRAAGRRAQRGARGKQPTNAQLVAFHKATGRDITPIPADYVTRWRTVIFERLRAAILTGRTR